MVKFIYMTDEMVILPVESSIISVKRNEHIDTYDNNKNIHKKYDPHEINLSIDDIIDTEYHESSYYKVIMETPNGRIYELAKFYSSNETIDFVDSIINSDETVLRI